MKKAVFFDCFGVVCSELAPVWLRKYVSEEDAVRIKESIFPRCDLGELNQKQTFYELEKISGIPSDRIKKEWEELVHINTELTDYIVELRKEHKVYMLSNACKETLEQILEKYDLYSIFDKVFISANMGLIKPSKEYFQYVLDDLGIDGKDAVMIDDNEKNIQGARNTGIDGIVFKNNQDLKEKLESFI